MVPFEKPWYQKLLMFALVIGAVGGVLAVLFTAI